jgi:hypothetical protein
MDSAADESFRMLTREVSGSHLRETFLNRVFKCTKYVGDHPERMMTIGIISSTTGGVLIDHSTFSQFLGIKEKSLARNFRDHKFRLEKTYDPSRELLDRVPDGVAINTRKWVLRRYPETITEGKHFEGQEESQTNEELDYEEGFEGGSLSSSQDVDWNDPIDE